ncbi:hypothetical protein CBR_g17931 [Chara braunii]|uniref:cysteine synthase n=1 Tax=Chara braunii TaxID=69332 RepID=A0A388KW37_CHABU|nr:hypothetical protein CBR_g17931 [Chara braunii]|eukprot:GBG74218.1 hypothetical protein CBR_g17931 [Chara braunii]
MGLLVMASVIGMVALRKRRSLYRAFLSTWEMVTAVFEEEEEKVTHYPRTNVSDGIVSGIFGAIGNTPLIRIASLSKETGCEILAKAEFLNPGGSVKDRVANQILWEAISSGELRTGGLVTEGSAGSTAISLAMAAAAYGCRCHVVIPDDVAAEKGQILEALGATVERVRPVSISHPDHYVHVAKRRAKEAEHIWACRHGKTLSRPRPPGAMRSTTRSGQNSRAIDNGGHRGTAGQLSGSGLRRGGGPMESCGEADVNLMTSGGGDSSPLWRQPQRGPVASNGYRDRDAYDGKGGDDPVQGRSKRGEDHQGSRLGPAAAAAAAAASSRDRGNSADGWSLRDGLMGWRSNGSVGSVSEDRPRGSGDSSEAGVADLRARGSPGNGGPKRKESERSLGSLDPQILGTEGGFFADQFENLANYRAHYEGTGREIWDQTGGVLNAFVAAAGTGGTIAGISRYLKERDPNIKCFLIDPPGSSLYNRVTRGVMYTKEEAEGQRLRNPFDTITEGIGINRLTKNFELALLDGAFKGTDREAVEMAQFIMKRDGLFVGSSSAMNLVGAVKVAKYLGPGCRIVTILCDSGTRHMSRFHNPNYLAELGLTPTAQGLEFIGERDEYEGRPNPRYWAFAKRMHRSKSSLYEEERRNRIPEEEGEGEEEEEREKEQDAERETSRLVRFEMQKTQGTCVQREAMDTVTPASASALSKTPGEEVGREERKEELHLRSERDGRWCGEGTGRDGEALWKPRSREETTKVGGIDAAAVVIEEKQSKRDHAIASPVATWRAAEPRTPVENSAGSQQQLQ